MPTADELLYSTDSAQAGNRLAISEDLRTVTVPEGQRVLGARSDGDVRRVWFDMPAECDGLPLRDFTVSVMYRNAAGDLGRYFADDVEESGGVISFSWLVGRGALARAGTVTASVNLRLYAGDGETVAREFNTTTFEMSVLESVIAEAEDVSAGNDALAALVALEWADDSDDIDALF